MGAVDPTPRHEGPSPLAATAEQCRPVMNMLSLKSTSASTTSTWQLYNPMDRPLLPVQTTLSIHYPLYAAGLY